MQAHQLIRDRLRQEMDRRALTAVALAKNAGVKNSFIYDILNGKSTNPSSVKLAQVAETLGLSLSWLAGAEKAAADDRVVAIPYLSAKTRNKNAYVYFSENWLRESLSVDPQHLRALEADGLWLIDTASTSPAPGMFALLEGNGYRVKELKTRASGEMRVVGRVVWLGRKL